ncbi:O-linked GlcNAc transferase [Spironucleus salmonicida]|uniref:protein O-GlcNAc transferase n=1 Tax=Spironucleus salmonicida TaxID=348837 RepID=V6LT85_9EUKA|nr:O-linked GlcNAc transferase [Spironucleus salmonicida]|eukprot:EST46906.1 O-linked GlcNAc transferase [Spironucleus salmonicida]
MNKNDQGLTNDELQSLRDLFRKEALIDEVFEKQQEIKKIQDINEFILNGQLLDAQYLIDNLNIKYVDIITIRQIYSQCKLNKQIPLQIEVMKKIFEYGQVFDDVIEQITNCYEIYQHQIAFNTIQKYLDRFEEYQNTWLLMELADYLLFFKRQYSKSLLLYQQLLEYQNNDALLSLNINIGLNIARYLTIPNQIQLTLNNGLHYLEQTKQLQIKERQRSYLYIKLGKLFYNISKPSLALECLHTAHLLDTSYLRPLFMIISLLQCQLRINLAKPLLKKAPINHYKTYHYYGIAAQFSDSHKEAVQFFTKSIQLNQTYMKNYLFIGDSYVKLSNFNRALECYQYALELDSNVPQIQMKIINIKAILCIYTDHQQDLNQVILTLDNYLHRTQNQQSSINIMKPINQPPMLLKQYYSFKMKPDLLHQLGKIIEIMNYKKNQLIIDQEQIQTYPFTFNHLLINDKKKQIIKPSKLGFLLQLRVDGQFLQAFIDFFKMIDQSKIIPHIYFFELQQEHYLQLFQKANITYTIFKEQNPIKIAQIIYSQHINILINMNMPDSFVCQICQLKPAPIQILYFQNPGSSGMKQYDYIIGDKVICPIQKHYFYTEQIIMLPICFQISSHAILFKDSILDEERNEFEKPIVNNNQVIIYDQDLMTGVIHITLKERTSNEFVPASYPIGKQNLRKYFNIPEDGFVFGTFSQFYKFDVEFLNMIVEIMIQCSNAYFICLESPVEAVVNIINYVDNKQHKLSSRFIFLPYLDIQHNIIRLRRSLVIDVLLDTVRLSGNYIIQDALFVGTLVLCQQKDYMGSRIASSYLSQVQLQDLICQSYSEMRDKAVQLYSDKVQFNHYKKILQKNYKNIFDLQEYVYYFQKAMLQVNSNWQQGLAPASFEVEKEPNYQKSDQK